MSQNLAKQATEVTGHSQDTVLVDVARMPGTEDIALPSYETLLSAGMDLSATVTEDLELRPGARALVPTGLRIALPPGYEAQVRPRSGLAAKHGLTVLNSPGTIDADYRGEIKVILANLGDETFTVTRGMRIAQMVVAPVTRVIWSERDALRDTERGGGGFGSTGV